MNLSCPSRNAVRRDLLRTGHSSACGDVIRSLHPDLKQLIKSAIRVIIANPEYGEPLKRELDGLLKYPVRCFQVFYPVHQKTRIIRLMAMGHYLSVYEESTERFRRKTKNSHVDSPTILLISSHSRLTCNAGEMKSIMSLSGLAICTLALVLVSGCATTPEEKLRQAAAEGNFLRVKTFLGQGVNAEAVDERGVTPLHLAVKHGHHDVVTLLLEQGAAINSARQDGVTPLFIAVQEGRRDVVALLLEKGANVNARARMGNVTLLHLGAFRGDQAIVTLLLHHGADKNARMSSGERPVDLAQTQGHETLIPLLEP